MRHAGYQTSWSRGFIRICALSMMRNGPVYGNMVAAELFELSDHQWKPGAGAIYPALHKLAQEGLAVARKERGRTVYSITRKGRSVLEVMQEQASVSRGLGLDFGRIWLGIMKPDNIAEHLLRRLRMNLSTIEAAAGGKQFRLSSSESEYLITQALGELRRAVGKLELKQSETVKIEGISSTEQE